jgi:tRNA G18 (ribose-2'-O)-methylase SpoU
LVLFTIDFCSQDASAQVLSEIKIAHDGADTIPDHDNARGIELLNRLVGTAAPLEDYQQKISILPDELLNNATSVRDQVVGAVRTRKRHDLVVVASLVDRVPNLGGLCRTCEIFNCAKLVVHDKSVVQDPVFTAISVTAHQWLPIEEVRESRVAAYLAEQKRAGYTILALEQTANSQSLEKFKFPSRAVILLGKEREGIPVHLISLVDACIEIPQFGLVRSLNVHVSGAILMWTYVRQHCLEGNAGESAQQVIAALPKLH